MIRDITEAPVEPVDGTSIKGCYVTKLNPLSGELLENAAAAVERLAAAYAEYVAAQRRIADVRTDVTYKDFPSQLPGDTPLAKLAGESAAYLREAAERRAAAMSSYTESLMEKCDEVAAMIHPQLNGILQALGMYASGEVAITEPVTYPDACGMHTFTPQITDANREAARAFKPAIYTAAPPLKDVMPHQLIHLADVFARHRRAVDGLIKASEDVREYRNRLADAGFAEFEAWERATGLQINDREAHAEAGTDAGRPDAPDKVK